MYTNVHSSCICISLKLKTIKMLINRWANNHIKPWHTMDCYLAILWNEQMTHKSHNNYAERTKIKMYTHLVFHYYNQIFKTIYLWRGRLFQSQFWRFTVQGQVGTTGSTVWWGCRMAIQSMCRRMTTWKPEGRKGSQAQLNFINHTPTRTRDFPEGLSHKHHNWIKPQPCLIPLTYDFGF